MFQAVAGEREVVFSWSPPAVALRNGNITGYTLSCSPSPASLPLTIAQPGTRVQNFSPNSTYNCSIVAHNIQGSGPPINIVFSTMEDCKFYTCS